MFMKKYLFTIILTTVFGITLFAQMGVQIEGKEVFSNDDVVFRQ